MRRVKDKNKKAKGSSTNTKNRLSEYNSKCDSWILNQIKKDFIDQSFLLIKKNGVTNIVDDEVGSRGNLITKSKKAKLKKSKIFDTRGDVMNNKKIARELLLIAQALVADYKYDPEHRFRPSGGQWTRTEKGWSTNGKEPSKRNFVQKIKDKIVNKIDRGFDNFEKKLQDKAKKWTHGLQDGVTPSMKASVRRDIRILERKLNGYFCKK